MSEDYIADALNDLDDDLIGEAAKCRYNQRSLHIKWMIPATAAAGLCIIFGAFFSAGGMDLISQNSEYNAVIEDSELHYSLQENLMQDTELMEQLQELPSVIITLEEHNAEGFTGVVTGFVDTNAIPLGSRVAVKVDSETELLYSSFSAESDADNKTVTDSCETVSVRVIFSPWKGEDFSLFADDAEKTYYIYAEQILPVGNDVQ